MASTVGTELAELAARALGRAVLKGDFTGQAWWACGIPHLGLEVARGTVLARKRAKKLPGAARHFCHMTGMRHIRCTSDSLETNCNVRTV